MSLSATYASLVLATVATSATSAPQSTQESLRAVPRDTLLLESRQLPDAQSRRFGNLPRILAHEALLLCARESFDRVLPDTLLDDRKGLPDGATGQTRYWLEAKADLTGTLRLQLLQDRLARPYDGVPEMIPGKPVWNHTLPINFSANTVLPSFVPQLELLSRTQLIDVLGNVKLDAARSRSGSDQSPLPDLLVHQINSCDIVSQFLAAHGAHRLIRERGATPARLSVLVRAYTHLSLLTRHHWNVTSDAYSARAWLYAERMVAADPNNRLARWTRAYATALGGVHNQALSDLEWLHNVHSNESNSRDPSSPTDLVYPEPWCRFVLPVCHYDAAHLLQLAENATSQRGIGHLLHLQAVAAQRHHGRFFRTAQETLIHAPCAFGIYDQISRTGLSGHTRWAASMASERLAESVVRLLAETAGVPPAARVLAARARPTRGFDFLGVKVPGCSPQLADVRRLCDKLRDVASDSKNPIWNELARMLEEELFITTVNQLQSHQPAVLLDTDRHMLTWWPLVRGHRYANYARILALQHPANEDHVRALYAGMNLSEFRPSMSAFWRHAQDHARSEDAELIRRLASREFTAHSLEASFDAIADTAELRQFVAREILLTSPHTPSALRYTIFTNPNAPYPQLQRWEQRASTDAHALTELGHLFTRRGYPDAGLRCMERSLVYYQQEHIAEYVAGKYWERRDPERWRMVWENFLKTHTSGLEYCRAHQQLAYGMLLLGDKKVALRHAVDAARDYSAGGLFCAATCYEAAGQWHDAEEFWRRLSEAYAGRYRSHWYRFCRRTGRGSTTQAFAFARNHLPDPSTDQDPDNAMNRVLLEMMDGDVDSAQDRVEKLYDAVHDQWYLCHAALLALETGHEGSLQRCKSKLEQRLLSSPRQVCEPRQDPPLERVCRLLLRRLQGEVISHGELERVATSLTGVARSTSADTFYFLGELARSQGNIAYARAMWDESYRHLTERGGINASLSGFRRLQHGLVSPAPRPRFSTTEPIGVHGQQPPANGILARPFGSPRNPQPVSE